MASTGCPPDRSNTDDRKMHETRIVRRVNEQEVAHQRSSITRYSCDHATGGTPADGSRHHRSSHQGHHHAEQEAAAKKEEDGGEEESGSMSSAASHSGSSFTASSGTSDSASSCGSGDDGHHKCHSCSTASGEEEDDDGEDSNCCSHSSFGGEGSCGVTSSGRSSNNGDSSTEGSSASSSIEWIRESTDRTSGSLFYVKILDTLAEDRSSHVPSAVSGGMGTAAESQQSLHDHHPHHANEPDSRASSTAAPGTTANKVRGLKSKLTSWMLHSGRRGLRIESADGKRKKGSGRGENESDKKDRNIPWKLRSKKTTASHSSPSSIRSPATAGAGEQAAAAPVVVASSTAGRKVERSSEVKNDVRREHQKTITTPATDPANDNLTFDALSPPASCSKHGDVSGSRIGCSNAPEGQDHNGGGGDGIGVRLRKKVVTSFPNVLQSGQELRVNPSERSSLIPPCRSASGEVERREEAVRMAHLLTDGRNGKLDGGESQSSDRSSGLILLYLTPVSESSSGGGAAPTTAAAASPPSSPNPRSGMTVNERDCLTYCFPPASSAFSSSDAVIARLKGMFLTLSHVVNGITDQKPIKSFITIKKTTSGVKDVAGGGGKETRRLSESNLSSETTSEEDEEEEDGERIGRSDNTDAYFIAYVHEYTSILMIALKEYWNDHLIRVSDLVTAVSRMIRFRFDSLDAAFKNPINHPSITHYLRIMMSTIINEPAVHDLSSMNLFSVPKVIMDDDELNLTISEILTEYEAKDWLASSINVTSSSGIDSVTMFAGGSCGDFIVAGTALFEKGYLIQSHLPLTSLSDIVTYMHFHGILRMSATASCKLVHWIEVHPNRGLEGEECESGFTSDFPENEGSRFFILIICVKQTLLTVLLEVPFLSVDSKVMPNETIILQSIRFIVSNLQRSGCMDQVNDHLVMQSKCQAVRMQRLNEIMSLGMGSLASSSSSAIGSMLLLQHSKGKLRNRIKSLSLRELFHNTTSTSLSPSQSQSQQVISSLISSSPTEGSQQLHQRRSLILSVPRSPEDLDPKSCSSPSLVHASGNLTTSGSKRRSSANVTSSGRMVNLTSNESTISSLSEAPAGSLIESELSISQNTTTTTTTSISDSQFSSCSLSFRSYFEEQRRRLPDNLILFIDQDSRSSIYVAPVLPPLLLPNDVTPINPTSGLPTTGCKLSQRLIRQQVVPAFRSCCLHLRKVIQSHYPVVKEYGMHFWIRESCDSPCLLTLSYPGSWDKKKHKLKKRMQQEKQEKKEKRRKSGGVTTGMTSSPVTPKGKSKTLQHPEKGVISFWAAVRKESCNREVFACFLVSTSGDKNHNNNAGNLIQLSSGTGLNVSMESLSYALSLWHREI